MARKDSIRHGCTIVQSKLSLTASKKHVRILKKSYFVTKFWSQQNEPVGEINLFNQSMCDTQKIDSVLIFTAKQEGCWDNLHEIGVPINCFTGKMFGTSHSFFLSWFYKINRNNSFMISE